MQTNLNTLNFGKCMVFFIYTEKLTASSKGGSLLRWETQSESQVNQLALQIHYIKQRLTDSQCDRTNGNKCESGFCKSPNSSKGFNRTPRLDLTCLEGVVVVRHTASGSLSFRNTVLSQSTKQFWTDWLHYKARLLANLSNSKAQSTVLYKSNALNI